LYSIDSGHQRANLASFDISTLIAALNSWEGQDGQGVTNNGDYSGAVVYALAASDNTKLYVGGNFSTVDGAAHPAIAAFDLSDQNVNLLADFASSDFADSDTIWSLAYNDGKVYAGGTFTQVNGNHFNNLGISG